tara:strand:+ start:1308 stop:2162 length:855 start_codon:yes stop_codon:yes gene_type:complete
MIKNINYFLQSLFVYSFFLIGRIFGLKISRVLFSKLFSIIGPFFKSKEIIKQNLNTFSKNLSNQEKTKIISDMWKNYGMTFIEYIFLKSLREKAEIKLKGENNIVSILERKKPVIFISGHFANFELMSMEITKKNINLATIYRPLNNFFLNPLMEYLRKKYICQNQIKKGLNGVREAIEYIKKNYSIALMIDQRVSEGEKIEFFGKEALTTTLPAQLAIKYSLDIVPVFIERVEESKFEIEFLDSINPKNFNDKLELTRKLNNILEEMIKKKPNQWIWTHNRWK